MSDLVERVAQQQQRNVAVDAYRGFVMLLMGFGCNVPALMGTRVMRSRSLRLLTMLVIPFSLCSARLQDRSEPADLALMSLLC